MVFSKIQLNNTYYKYTNPQNVAFLTIDENVHLHSYNIN